MQICTNNSKSKVPQNDVTRIEISPLRFAPVEMTYATTSLFPTTSYFLLLTYYLNRPSLSFGEKGVAQEFHGQERYAIVWREGR